MRDLTNSPFFLRLAARMRGPQGVAVGKLRRVMISDVVAYNADSHFSTIISGIPNNDIEDVQLNNIRIYYRQIDSPLNVIQTLVPEHEKTYPEPQKMGVMPSYGFFIRHVKNIAMNNVEISYMGKETRPPFIIENVKGIELRNVKSMPVPGVDLFKLKNVENILIKDSKGVKDKASQNVLNDSW